MARTLAQVQATLTTLYASYDALAAKLATSIGANGRQMAYRSMEEVQKQISALEEQEAQLTAAGAPLTAPAAGVAFAQFSEPRSGY